MQIRIRERNIGFEMQTDHPIQARRSDLVLINNNIKTSQIVNLTVPAEDQVKVKKKKTSKIPGPFERAENMRYIKVTVIIVRTTQKKTGKETKGSGDEMKN